MAYDLEEQEQIAALKAWWNQYGTAVLAAVTVILFGIAAWNGWNWYERQQAAKASGLYEELQQAVKANNVAVVKENATALTQKFGRTVYAALAMLQTARLNHEANEFTAAQENLQWVIDKSNHSEFVPLARVRLAAVLLDAKSYDAALKVLEGAPPAEHRVAFDDRRGDVLFAMGKTEEARAAWQTALEGAGLQHPLQGLIQFKLDALPPVEKS